MNLKETGCAGVNWIHWDQDMDHWWALENMVMNLQIPQKMGNLTSWLTISFSRTLLHGASDLVHIINPSSRHLNFHLAYTRWKFLNKYNGSF
jgi:hypothetical protein